MPKSYEHSRITINRFCQLPKLFQCYFLCLYIGFGHTVHFKHKGLLKISRCMPSIHLLSRCGKCLEMLTSYTVTFPASFLFKVSTEAILGLLPSLEYFVVLQLA